MGASLLAVAKSIYYFQVKGPKLILRDMNKSAVAVVE